MFLFAVTIFLSAFLLFQVQPLIGKYILPWYGGGPAVWTTCMLFFQVVLLLGYAYAHLLSIRIPRNWQGWLHMALLAAAVCLLPISPEPEVWKPTAEDEPTLHILLLLMVNVGVPYLLLSSTAPLVQRWFSHSFPGRSPYRLYALSNTGSLLALLSYPFAVEPTLTLSVQVSVWCWGFAAYAVLCAWCAAAVRGSKHETSAAPASVETSSSQAEASSTQVATDDLRRPRTARIWLWLGLSAVASAMLLATTNQMCQEVAVVPFLWVLPLALYLLTFIICFNHAHWYSRRRIGLLLALTTPAACVVLWGGAFVDIRIQIAVYSLTLFACCMACHGELVRAKPNPRHLTLFYLILSAGGALGGVFVALLAPSLFLDYWEYHISLAGCILLTLIAIYRSRDWVAHLRDPAWAWGGLGFAMLLLISSLAAQAYLRGRSAIVTSRNFYGVLRVTEIADKEGPQLALSHGKIVHGLQFIDDAKRSWPTAYYGPQSGIGLAVNHHPRRNSPDPGDRCLRVGMVGLGVGTAAVYGRPGDYLRFYEIDPDVLDFAERYFTYGKDTRARIDVVLGDARIQMEREASGGRLQEFDVLAVDAFSSDSIPVHLLTNECVDLYWRHLKGDGILAFHITNRSLDLAPVVRGLADRFGYPLLSIEQDADDKRGIHPSNWVILTNNQAFLDQPEVRAAAVPPSNEEVQPLVWTDDFASLWQVLKY